MKALLTLQVLKKRRNWKLMDKIFFREILLKDYRFLPVHFAITHAPSVWRFRHIPQTNKRKLRPGNGIVTFQLFVLFIFFFRQWRLANTTRIKNVALASSFIF